MAYISNIPVVVMFAIANERPTYRLHVAILEVGQY